MPSAWEIRAAAAKSWRSVTALENLYLNTDVPKPSITPHGSALVRVRAAAINARDVMVIAHDPIYGPAAVDRLVPCADGSGEVEAVGDRSVWKVGDRVMILPFEPSFDEFNDKFTIADWKGKEAGDVPGTMRQYAVFEDAHLIRVPDHLSFEQSATVLAASGTASNALFFGPKKVRKGMTVLTQGTGGVSCFAIQLAVAAGATVISTSSTDAKLVLAKKLGATHTINYTTHPEWENEVLRLTGGLGVDHVIEVAGSSTVEQSLASTKRGGAVSLVGFLTESKAVDLIPAILWGAKIVRGVLGFSKEHCDVAVKMFEEHKLEPMVGQVFEWENAVEAFAVSMGNTAVGKIVIQV